MTLIQSIHTSLDRTTTNHISSLDILSRKHPPPTLHHLLTHKNALPFYPNNRKSLRDKAVIPK